MNTKLTLTIEQEVIAKAKKYAKAKERSLSDLIENYLKAITKETVPENVEITPTVKALKGSFTAPAGFDYQQELSKRLSKKYL